MAGLFGGGTTMGRAGGPRPGSAGYRTTQARATGEELDNTRTQFDMDLDRDRLALEQQRADLERQRMERQSGANDALIKLAQGGAGGAGAAGAPAANPVPGAAPGGGANPSALGILSTASLGMGGSGSPQQTQVQDRAAQRTTGALANLERSAIDRGILGSGVHQGQAADVVASAGDDLLDADVMMLGDDQDRMAEIEDRNYSGGQRAIDREFQRKQSLLDLLAGVRY